MADGGDGASRILGVLVGVMLVIFIDAAILMYSADSSLDLSPAR